MKKIALYISIGILIGFPYTILGNDCNYNMSTTQMNKIIESMNNQLDDLKKLNIIKMYLERLCVNTEQMLIIMEVFESEKLKNDFFMYSKTYITDIENYNQVKIK